MDCIVNVTQNWGIGKDGDLLVSIPTDLRRFRALTTGKTVIYGRKTLLTFPHARPLPNRENWILSATPGLRRINISLEIRTRDILEFHILRHILLTRGI